MQPDLLYYFDIYAMWLLLESIVVLCCEANVSFTGVFRLSINEITIIHSFINVIILIKMLYKL